MEKENEIIRFDLARLKKDSQKLCKCEKPHYTVDLVNRLIQCDDCGAYVDPFECLSNIIDRRIEYETYQERAVQKLKWYNEELQKKHQAWRWSEFPKTANAHIKNGLMPVCPHCKEVINVSDISGWSNGWKEC